MNLGGTDVFGASSFQSLYFSEMDIKVIYQLREPVCQCPTWRSGVNNPLHFFSCFSFDKNIRIGRNPRDHLFQPSFIRGENWDPGKKRIHSRSHSESVEEIRSLTFCLLLWCSLYHSKVFLPGQFPSFLCFLAASPLYTILHSPLTAREFI